MNPRSFVLLTEGEQGLFRHVDMSSCADSRGRQRGSGDSRKHPVGTAKSDTSHRAAIQPRRRLLSEARRE